MHFIHNIISFHKTLSRDLGIEEFFLMLCCCYVASVMSDSVLPHRRQPTRLLHPRDFQARVLEWVAIAFSFICSRDQKYANAHTKVPICINEGDSIEGYIFRKHVS